MAANEPHDRHLGLRVFSPERRELGGLEHHQSLAANLLLLGRVDCMHREREKSPRRRIALVSRQLWEGLQQAMHQEAALEAVTADIGQRRQGGGLASAGLGWGQWPRWSGLGGR